MSVSRVTRTRRRADALRPPPRVSAGSGIHLPASPFQPGKKTIVADAECVVDVEHGTADDVADMWCEQLICQSVAVTDDVTIIGRR